MYLRILKRFDNFVKLNPPFTKIWRPENRYFIEKPKHILREEHLIVSGKYLMTGTELKANSIWNIQDVPRRVFDEHIKSDSESDEKLYDIRIRGRFLVIFEYDNELPDLPRRIHHAIVIDTETNKKLKTIQPCSEYESLPDEDWSSEDESSDNYRETCFWQSYRELTVIGDSQNYGREVWIAQLVEKRTKKLRLKIFDLGGTSVEPVLIIDIEPDKEIICCGPHLILRPKNGVNLQADSKDEIGIHFIRIEFDTLNWFWKKCFAKYPDQAIEDLKHRFTRTSFRKFYNNR